MKYISEVLSGIAIIGVGAVIAWVLSITESNTSYQERIQDLETDIAEFRNIVTEAENRETHRAHRYGEICTIIRLHIDEGMDCEYKISE